MSNEQGRARLLGSGRRTKVSFLPRFSVSAREEKNQSRRNGGGLSFWSIEMGLGRER